MQRVNKRQRLYKDKDFQVQSLTSLVKIAKERTIEKMENPNNVNVKLPLQDLTERLTESLEQMHHNLQSLLMQKLGPDARNIIAAERARQTRAKTERLEAREPNDKMKEDNVAKTLAEVGSEGGDELEMLNAYRERYAGMLADLAIARDSLVTMETTLQDEGVGGLAVQKRVSEDMDKLGRPRRRSKSSDLSLTSGDEMAKGRRRKGRRRGSRDTEVDDRGKRRRRSSGISSDLSVSSEEEPGKGKNRRRSTGQSSGEKHGTMEPIGVIRRVWK
jgi:hypothetical protein